MSASQATAEYVREVIGEAQSLIVTIDGPAGTGKSSVARLLASRLGLDFLDTGAMYRAAAAIVIDQGIDPDDREAVVAAVAREDLHFDWSADPPTMLCSGRSVMKRIREPDVTALVSRIAAIGPLRQHMVRKQRIVAAQHPRLVAEGRDQGSVVFPDADVKFYLDATPAERARRRAEQLREQGQQVDEARLLTEIESRDRQDSSRPDGPLMCPEDAHRLDTSALSFDEVVDTLEKLVLAQLEARRRSRASRGAAPPPPHAGEANR